MHWKTWTKISSIILLLLAIAGFYYANYHKEGAVLSIQNFPAATDLDSIDTSKGISFSFFLYNKGDQVAFVKSIIFLRYAEDGSQVTDTLTVDPKSDFTVDPGETKEIKVSLPASGEEQSYSLAAEVFYDEEKISSETVPVRWGALL